MKLKITAIGLCFASALSAQNNTVGSGGDAIGAGGTVAYSIGQTDYITNTGSGGTVSQGVQQTYTVLSVGVDAYPAISLNFEVFPNPVSNQLTLALGGFDLENLSYQIIDAAGKLVITQKITSNQSKVDMQYLANAIYFLKVMQNADELKSFKVVKNN
jgi:Secretion system C-terminal sorting domain